VNGLLFTGLQGPVGHDTTEELREALT